MTRKMTVRDAPRCLAFQAATQRCRALSKMANTKAQVGVIPRVVERCTIERAVCQQELIEFE
jgi:hypothetical protein